MQENMLGKRIKKLREENNITQIEFAKILNIGNTTLSQYESGKRIPSDEVKQKIALYFNVTLDFLLGTSDIRNPYQEDTIHKAIDGDPELLEFYEEMKHRDNLKLLFKQTKDMNDKDINQILRIIKAIEDEEDGDA